MLGRGVRAKQAHGCSQSWTGAVVSMGSVYSGVRKDVVTETMIQQQPIQNLKKITSFFMMDDTLNYVSSP